MGPKLGALSKSGFSILYRAYPWLRGFSSLGWRQTAVYGPIRRTGRCNFNKCEDGTNTRKEHHVVVVICFPSHRPQSDHCEGYRLRALDRRETCAILTGASDGQEHHRQDTTKPARQFGSVCQATSMPSSLQHWRPSNRCFYFWHASMNPSQAGLDHTDHCVAPETDPEHP